jgi:uncharacterized protein YjbI with pentapeptide repeats
VNLQTVGEVLKVGGGGAALLASAIKLVFWFLERRGRTRLKARLHKQKYAVWDVDAYTRHYVEPDCQSVDPAGSEEPRLTIATREPVFSTLDKALSQESESRYIIVLADSGMGKSALLLNYYAGVLKNRRRMGLQVRLFPANGFSRKDVMTLPDRDQTVLFLDALDEDMVASADLKARLRSILEATKDFRKIVITCRTQFFSKDDEIPTRTGVIRMGPRSAGQSAEYLFHKLYLSPFNDEQIERYLKKRYRLFQRGKRTRAAELAKKIPNIAVRPMLLAHIDTLLGTTRTIRYSFELYEEMIEAWLAREEGMVEGVTGKELREFSERLAVDLFCNHDQRGSERIPKPEIAALARQWGIPLEEWKLTSRSLLNRDADGNYKFAHRSIMEYLFVKRHVSGAEEIQSVPWTDQMRTFLVEMIKWGAAPLAGLSNVDLEGAALPGQRLERAHLCGANISRGKLRDVDLTGADLRDARMMQASLEHATLVGVLAVNADLTGARAPQATLKDADLSQARLERAHFGKADLSGCRLVRADFRAADLSGANLTRVNARKAVFNGANMLGAILVDADVSDASFLKATLGRAVLRGANLAGSDLGQADLTGADLSGATLERAILTGAKLANVIFNNADKRTDLSQARLHGAHFGKADLSGCRLVGADLQASNLCGVNLSRVEAGSSTFNDAVMSLAILVDADLSNASFLSAHLDCAVLQRANLAGSDLQNADLTDADLNGATLEGAILTGTKLSRVGLKEANLSRVEAAHATFNDAEMLEANLVGANLSKASFLNAQLGRAVLTGANLAGSDLRKAKLMGADLSGATLTGANITGAFMRGALLKNAEGLTRDQRAEARLSGAVLDPEPLALPQPLASSQDIRMPWETPGPQKSPVMMPWEPPDVPVPDGDRELDAIILEYLSDESDSD